MRLFGKILFGTALAISIAAITALVIISEDESVKMDEDLDDSIPEKLNEE